MANRLAHETSPYLRQHAENPVDWYPWGEQALARARAEDKPILLSIGYSACHWCHVMAHESFEDPATAQLMNRLYVNIKVDREERPDLDQIYQTTHQWLSGRAGGWPLTVLMTPEHVPFFSGTYFPPAPRHGLPAFRTLLERAEQVYRTQGDEIAKQGAILRAALAQSQPQPPVHAAAAEDEAEASTAAVHQAAIEVALEKLKAQYDAVNGGFGRAPKFPQPHQLAFFMRHDAAPIVHTLRKMAHGGLYDQLGGGFCRYSVDAQWIIPHFEKMLYDNGALLALYADAYTLTREPLFARVVEDTVAWALREMRAEGGGFYAALDADSEGEEGRFYVWSRDEVAALLAADEYAVAAAHYGLDRPPNFEEHWHLCVVQPLESVAASLERPLDEVQRDLASARAKLLAARSARVRPGLDDKILTSWNALMIRGLARAARVFDRADWLAAACAAADFLRGAVWRDGRLAATWQAGSARHAGYLDDYAFLLDALLELMQAGSRPQDLEWARALGTALLTHFEDKERGGFFFTSHDHEALIYRNKPIEDHATPSGNGIAAYALQRLGHLTGATEYPAAAERSLRLFQEMLAQAPQYLPSLLGALEEYLGPPQHIVLRGPAAEVESWRRALAQRYLPHAMVIALPNEIDIATVPASLQHPRSETVAAYVCTGTTCLPPVTRLEDIPASLHGSA
ncbi:MAG TPA: thioredoxin domain-containing protein [Burkholderiaceae bacterium]|nr:thioredoxin domain-containing protein [Burkholderiaceae bacterium]